MDYLWHCSTFGSKRVGYELVKVHPNLLAVQQNLIRDMILEGRFSTGQVAYVPQESPNGRSHVQLLQLI